MDCASMFSPNVDEEVVNWLIEQASRADETVDFLRKKRSYTQLLISILRNSDVRFRDSSYEDLKED
jgi:hypothetical protein